MMGRIDIKLFYVYVRKHPLQFYDPYGYQATSWDDGCSWRSGQNGEVCPPDCTTQFTRAGDPWCDCPPSSQRKQCLLREPCYKNLGNCIEKWITASNLWFGMFTIQSAQICYNLTRGASFLSGPALAAITLWSTAKSLFCIGICFNNPCMFM